jgi:hypothetical protein
MEDGLTLNLDLEEPAGGRGRPKLSWKEKMHLVRGELGAASPPAYQEQHLTACPAEYRNGSGSSSES